MASTLIPAGRLNRWVASIIDGFLLGLLLLPFLLVAQYFIEGQVSLDTIDSGETANNPLVIILALLITGFYKIGFLIRDEATPGKKWRNLKVALKTGQRINSTHAFIREISQIIYLIPLLGALIYLISALLVLFTKNRKALHDHIGGTIVIKT